MAGRSLAPVPPFGHASRPPARQRRHRV